MMNTANLMPVGTVTVGWVIMYYTNMQFAGATCNVLKKETNDRQKDFAQRNFLNMHEQSPAFLTSMWLHAVFVNQEDAATLGTCYLGFTAIYTLFRLYHKGGVPDGIFLTTLPRYSINLYLALSYLYDIKGALGGSLLLSVGACAAGFLGVFPIAQALSKSLVPWFADSDSKEK